MRRNKNITLNLKNITPHFTGKNKIITLISIIIILSFANITLCFSNIFNSSNVSALSYSSSAGVGFTFNPTLSVNISPSDLVIPNLVPGNTLDSNVINVSIASNASYGYTLSAIVNGNNSNLTHTNGTNTFSSIATDADLSDLEDSEDTNIWGYSYKDNTVETPAWSNYNGLSSSNSTTLINTNSNVSSNLDFKIAAKASSTQPSGTYTGTINFTAVSNVAPMSLLDSFIASGAEMYNGYFKMQDMTHSICSNVDIEESKLQLIDVRDNKVYWVAKLKDGNCWMTQNLDLDLDSNRIYTHYDTDLGWNNPSNLDTNATWQPDNSTIDFTIGSTISGWQDSTTKPYSANPGEVYFYTSNSDANDIQYNSLQECINAGHNDCAHYHAGNYYNWSAAVASNNATSTADAQENSICPKSFRLPIDNEYAILLKNQNILDDYKVRGFYNLRINPLYFARFGYITSKAALSLNEYGCYWSSATKTNTHANSLYFNKGNIWKNDSSNKIYGYSVRCLVR